MFKLLKLMAYAALGYFLYEMYLGLTGQPSAMGEMGNRRQGRQGPSAEDLGADAWKGTPDQGAPVQVQDAGGAVSTRYVGRGVVMR